MSTANAEDHTCRKQWRFQYMEKHDFYLGRRPDSSVLWFSSGPQRTGIYVIELHGTLWFVVVQIYSPSYRDLSNAVRQLYYRVKPGTVCVFFFSFYPWRSRLFQVSRGNITVVTRYWSRGNLGCRPLNHDTSKCSVKLYGIATGSLWSERISQHSGGN